MRTYIIWLCAILALVITQPATPVWAGTVLLLTGISSVRVDLSLASPKRRWAAFKRIAFIGATGMMLVLAGFQIDSAPWNMQVESAVQAKHAMLSLAVYCISLFGTPVLIWAHISQRQHSRRLPVRSARSTDTLAEIAVNNRRSHARMAV